MESIGIVGAGAWGATLALTVRRPVVLWARDMELGGQQR